MPVTGTNDFTVTRNDVIKAVLRKLGVIGLGETPQTEDYTNCSQAMNIMIKSWAKKGWPLWTVQQLEIPMVPGILNYPLGPAAGYLDTAGCQITDAGTGGVDGTHALTITDAGGGTGATGTYTVAGGVVTAITITAAGSAYVTPILAFPQGGTATGTATVVGLTTNKPVRAFTAFLRNPQDYDTTLLPISKQEYDTLGYKFNESVPNQFYYDNQLDNGYMKVYNVPADFDYTVFLSVERMFYDMTTAGDDFDFPQECYQALVWGLAAEVAIEYGTPLDQIPYYEQKAQKYIDDIFDFSVEEADVYFTLDYNGFGTAR